MIKIFYNPDYPELIFAAAVFLLNAQEKYPDEEYCLIPMQAKDLDKSEPQIIARLAEDMAIIMGEEYSYFGDDCGNVLYVLLGIFPENKKDEKNIYDFFIRHERKIILWIDWHQWADGLAYFLNSQSDVIHIEPALTCLEIMKKKGFEIFTGALKAEKAMRKPDMKNLLAGRYLKVFITARALGINTNMLESCLCFAFISSVDELVVNTENKGLSIMAETVNKLIQEADLAKEDFDDSFPEFQTAKEMGRPVGCLLLGEVEEYFCVEKIMEYGIQKYPWLCVVGYIVNGMYLFHFASDKIPITEIVEAYSLNVKSKEEFFKILNTEITRVSTA